MRSKIWKLVMIFIIAMVAFMAVIFWLSSVYIKQDLGGGISAIISLSVIFPIFCMIFMWRGIKKLMPGAQKQHLLKNGVQAQAIIQSVQDMGITVNNMYIGVKLEVQVKSVGHGTFPATVENMVSRINIPRPGDEITVIFDPNNPQDIAVM